tara:strand:- start:169 stop:657 length:489 start_codon:yes stop_codon:yes gene_type:complete
MKYNKINKGIENELQEVLNFIVHDLRVNILTDWRDRMYPEYRSLLNTIAFRKHKLSPSEMAKFYKNRGLKYTTYSYMHSVRRFDDYSFNLPELKYYLNMFFKESTPADKKIVIIDKSALTPIQRLVSDLTSKENTELTEMIELRKKSWKWKSKNNYEVINSY